MTVAQYASFFLALYVLAIAGLTWLSQGREDHQGYIIGNRNLNYFTTICSMLAGQFNGGGVFLIFTFGMLYGYGLQWFVLGFVAAYAIMAIFAKQVYEEGIAFRDINVPDIIERRIGNLSRNFSSFIIIGKALLFGAAQLLIAGTVIAIILGLPKVMGIWLTAGIVAAYVSIGGYLTVARTDILQWGILFLVATAVLFFYPFPTMTRIATDFVTTDPTFKWGAGLFSLTLMLSNADPWQRIQSSKSVKVARISLISSSLVFVLFVFFSLIFVVAYEDALPDKTSFFDLFKLDAMPNFVLAIIGVFTFSAVMSTVDTQVQLMTSTLSKNILKIDIVKSRDKFIKYSRISTIIALSIMALAASVAGESTEFILKAFSFAYILAPVMIITMIWGKTADRYKDICATFALTMGLIIYLYMFFGGHFIQIQNNVVPAGITLLILVVTLGARSLKKSLIRG